MHTVFRWVKVYKVAKLSIKNATGLDRLKTSITKVNMAAVKTVEEQDPRLSVKDTVLAYQKTECNSGE